MEPFDRKLYKFCSAVFFYAVTLVLPLYFENAYFNMLEAKAHIYKLSVFFLVPFLCAALVMQIKSHSAPIKKVNLCWTDWAVLFLGICCMVSCLCSGAVSLSFWGTAGWSVGAFTLCSLPVFYLIVSRYLDYRPNLWLPVLLVNIFIFVVGILHSAGIDVFSMHEGIVDYQLHSYISTVGQMNWYGCYLCLLSPMLAVSYLASEDRNSSLIYYGTFFLAVLNVVLCASDGVYLGLGFCVFFAVPYIFGRNLRLERAFHLLTAYGVSLLAVWLAPCFAGKVQAMNKGIAVQLLNGKVAVLVILAGTLGTVLTRTCGRFLTDRSRWWIAAVLELCLLAVVAVMFAREAANFGDSWGTRRGLIWRMSMETYQSLPPGRKLLGVGPEMLRDYYQELSDVFMERVLVSHSEPLQYLLTTGAVGLLSWAGVWVSLFAGYFRYRVWEKDLTAFFLPLSAYFAQAFVNSPQTEGIALFYLMLSCYQRILRTEITAERL